jgi:hypothetical protein
MSRVKDADVSHVESKRPMSSQLLLTSQGWTFHDQGWYSSHVSRLEFSKALKEGTSESAIEHLIDQLDSDKGVLLTSSYEFPGRYARWSLGMV